MKRARNSHIRGEGGIAIWIIVVFILAGIAWFLYASRGDTVKEARRFAEEVSRKMAVDFDDRYLVTHLNPENQAAHLPSWRDRMFRNLRSFGPMTKPIAVTGDVFFTSYFFEPRGTYKVDLTYATLPAHLDLNVSKGISGWRIDELNLVWNPPTPTPAPVVAASPTPTPTPSPTPTPAKRKKR